MTVEWREAPSFPGFSASSLGQIRTPTGKVPVWGSVDSKKRRRIYRYRGKTYRVHRIVADAFLGVCPEGLEVMHLNEDGTDNRPSNLRYGTRKENLNFPGFLEYCRGRTGANNPHIKGRNNARAA